MLCSPVFKLGSNASSAHLGTLADINSLEVYNLADDLTGSGLVEYNVDERVDLVNL